VSTGELHERINAPHDRLNRGGDRQANTALYRIVVVRLRWHEPTRKDMARRTTQGLSKKEIIRCFIGGVSAL
jgi:hypothetical protein